MATKPVNNIVRDESKRSLFSDATKVISALSNWNQGDLLYFDDATNLLKPVASDATAADLCGVAVQTVVDGKVKSPYQGTAVDAAEALAHPAGPVYGVVAKLKAKVGDAYAPGDKVYADATDAQTVSSAGTKVIGVYQGSTIATAVAGDMVECLIGSRFPTDALKT